MYDTKSNYEDVYVPNFSTIALRNLYVHLMAVDLLMRR
jgi:hypothetical protein